MIETQASTNFHSFSHTFLYHLLPRCSEWCLSLLGGAIILENNQSVFVYSSGQDPLPDFQSDMQVRVASIFTELISSVWRSLTILFNGRPGSLRLVGEQEAGITVKSSSQQDPAMTRIWTQDLTCSCKSSTLYHSSIPPSHKFQCRYTHFPVYTGEFCCRCSVLS